MSRESSTELRRATARDADAVRDLVREAYAKWVPVIGREPMPMRVDYAQAIREHEIDLLFIDERLAALIEVIAHPDHLFIENIAVAPVRQGQGLGRRLLRHAEQRATASQLRKLRLLTNQAFAANIRLYESAGYRVDRTEPFADGGITVYMSKDLPIPENVST